MPATNKPIYLSLAEMGGKEQEFIQEAFDTNWVVPLGPNVDGFEEELKEYLRGDKEVVALISGTAALHLALLQLGIEAGDEVFCQSFTFAASANPIKYLGAEPVFIGSEPSTWNMDPIYLARALEDRLRNSAKKPKAIIVVHLYGMPARMGELRAIADQYDIPLIEDAAEALGSSLESKLCGNWGDFGILSFNGNKIITTSGGGALLCPDKATAATTKFYATQARDDAPHYQHSKIGYNYRLSNICAGIGRGQLMALDRFIARRREINSLYRTMLADVEGISFQTEPDTNFFSNYWLTTIIIEPSITGFTREDLRQVMLANNIETRPLWKPMHLQPVFADTLYYGSGVEEELFEKGLCLPSGAGLTNDDIQRIASIIKHTHP
ncbi:MAG: aminotransferase class I/II-fold pyridoxal phosphate-dependent enzyme [Bacteroidales bacterium]|jgi:dTDP-4-amino-4,6-dideoxygalactose transaminase|nr:aminotransferase class I/II-fold pyridoxal phosphate-dependent enzyme [Bacteroidales bacterium]MDY0370589.1 aminotransferase class I/II-fold pyridoxal phosphate-dependent enzyme [Bacteroidales bacterium]